MPNIDWMHMNAALWDKRDDGIIVSSPMQSMVVKIDSKTSGIKWILGPHEGYEGRFAYLKKYLLTPVGKGFEWQWCQHKPMILPRQDDNPAALDILLLDNGQSKSFTKAGSISPQKNYSRGVQYRIDENKMTIRQIWQYGKERGTECYTTFLGSADYLPASRNRLIAFGGQLGTAAFRPMKLYRESWDRPASNPGLLKFLNQARSYSRCLPRAINIPLPRRHIRQNASKCTLPMVINIDSEKSGQSV